MRLAEGSLVAATVRFTEASMIYRKSIGVVGWVCRGLSALARSLGRDIDVRGKVAVPSGLTAGDQLMCDFFKAH
jgi:hypothetical protein